LEHPDRFYVGVTADLRTRLKKHNAGEVSHTSKYAPWTIKTYVAFSDEKQAFAFEKYLKSPSGRAFAKKTILTNARPDKAEHNDAQNETGRPRAAGLKSDPAMRFSSPRPSAPCRRGTSAAWTPES
jgi:predicted GIY-YIG superfamily endonuclease